MTDADGYIKRCSEDLIWVRSGMCMRGIIAVVTFLDRQKFSGQVKQVALRRARYTLAVQIPPLPGHHWARR